MAFAAALVMVGEAAVALAAEMVAVGTPAILGPREDVRARVTAVGMATVGQQGALGVAAAVAGSEGAVAGAVVRGTAAARWDPAMESGRPRETRQTRYHPPVAA